MLCDSGASVNIIDEHVYDKLANKVVLRRTREKLYAYGSKSPLPLLGKFSTVVEANSKYVTATFYVVKGHSGSLLCYDTAKELKVMKIINSMTACSSDQANERKTVTGTMTKTESLVKE